VNCFELIFLEQIGHAAFETQKQTRRVSLEVFTGWLSESVLGNQRAGYFPGEICLGSHRIRQDKNTPFERIFAPFASFALSCSNL